MCEAIVDEEEQSDRIPVKLKAEIGALMLLETTTLASQPRSQDILGH